MNRHDSGFTLVELMVALFITAAIMTAAYSSFITISRSFKTVTKQTETQMESSIGLDILRHDIEMAGYGLPRGSISPSLGYTYNEAVSDGTYTPDPQVLNDATANEPRSVVIGNNTGPNTSDAFAIKSLDVSSSKTTEKWSYVYYDGASWVLKSWNDTRYDLSTNDRVIFVSPKRKDLQLNTSNSWTTTLTSGLTYTSNMPTPGDIDMIYLLYGVDGKTDLRMPFNRADYFLYRDPTNFPAKCNAGTYTLYRGLLNQSNGMRDAQPLLDCVADFQVAFGLDVNNIGVITWTDSALPAQAPDIDYQLKEIRIYILLQEGQFDRDYTYPSSTILIGDSDITLKNFALSTLSANYANYKWRVYKLVAKPLNIS
ncbi:MAG: prepilin-type N-terminal cleavage/methylation domain-containing protein [Nitrospirae bacterium]|uniref:Type IV pilus assembly protein PilW n=1 Tax=uncultured Nitrospirae bacterium MY3-5B TaxID=798578 RepID=D9MP38_9BACT|nr:hypothetical protein LW3_0240 [uncultured Nitrospirae bacterium MY3-5B]MBF0319841.1 prepilin-type N-terminal cleavage/methylation domain-containing protein [Nitrospirota bacterium]